MSSRRIVDRPLPAPIPDGIDAKEVVLDHGRARQAGADTPEGAWITNFRLAAEQDLYIFAKLILGRHYLTENLHHAVARFLQTMPPMRKCLLIPRGHGKTSIVSHALPLHCFIQPRATNVYFPDTPGCETRIILIGETERRAQDAVKIVRNALEANALLKALWPHVTWDEPSRQAKKWNDTEFIIPGNSYPDPSLRGIGVGGATAGCHPSALIKDDMIAETAANSPVEMQSVIDYHKASRALINEAWQCEWTIGTRWAIGDLYETELLQDESVEARVLGIVEDGVPIWPERVTVTDEEADAWNAEHPRKEWKRSVPSYQRESGIYFPLFYMNQPYDPSLTDFRESELRTYTLVGEEVCFPIDARDGRIAATTTPPARRPERSGRRSGMAEDIQTAHAHYARPHFE